MHIHTGNLTHPAIIQLLSEHLRSVAQHSPPESIHALNLDGLIQPDITFYSAWRDHELLGVGALKELNATHGEIKSMRTATEHLRNGIAKHVLQHILTEAKRRDYTRLSLETGSMAAFAPARNLYTKFGFQSCPPFADYVEDPYSTFMTLEI